MVRAKRKRKLQELNQVKEIKLAKLEHFHGSNKDSSKDPASSTTLDYPTKK